MRWAVGASGPRHAQRAAGAGASRARAQFLHRRTTAAKSALRRSRRSSATNNFARWIARCRCGQTGVTVRPAATRARSDALAPSQDRQAMVARLARKCNSSVPAPAVPAQFTATSPLGAPGVLAASPAEQRASTADLAASSPMLNTVATSALTCGSRAAAIRTSAPSTAACHRSANGVAAPSHAALASNKGPEASL